MTKVLSILSSIKLSLQQWLLVTMAATIGLLVVAFRVQGTRLHKYQVMALSAAIDAAQGQEDDKLASLKEKFYSTLQEYIESGGN